MTRAHEQQQLYALMLEHDGYLAMSAEDGERLGSEISGAIAGLQ